MDTFRSNSDREQDVENAEKVENDYAYEANDWTAQASSKTANFGLGLLKALRLNGHNQLAVDATPTVEIEPEQAAEFAGFVNETSAETYAELAPVYRGEYKNLSPIYFNTEPVDNANDTRLDRSRLATYTRAQLFFLLRLERFLRLRHHWQKASPRQDEDWKTALVMRSIFSALEDCIKHEVGADARTLLTKWGCC